MADLNVNAAAGMTSRVRWTRWVFSVLRDQRRFIAFSRNPQFCPVKPQPAVYTLVDKAPA